MITFRVEEEVTLINEDDLDNVFDYRQYQCRYYQVSAVPGNWDDLTLANKESYLRANGSLTWYYDEDFDGDTVCDDKVTSVERLTK